MKKGSKTTKRFSSCREERNQKPQEGGNVMLFSESEQKAIEEKLEQLRKVRDGTLTPQELANLITQRRVFWFEENENAVLSKYHGLPDQEKAYRIIFFDHMRINPERSKMIKISKGKIRIESYNFCPYLEACRRLGLDTIFVCKEIGEPSIREVCKLINPDLKFSRNYQNIRPYNNFCEEYFELSK